VLRWITRLVLLFALGLFAPGEAAARVAMHVGPPDVAAQKLVSWGSDPETAVLRQAATRQAAETQQAASSISYDFASGCLLAAESAAARTTLYRAVSPGEFADAVGNQVLRPGPNSYATGKFFAETAEHAAQWGKALEGPGKFRIIQVEFESGAASQFMRWQRLDGIGPARFGTFEQMAPLKISPLGTP